MTPFGFCCRRLRLRGELFLGLTCPFPGHVQSKTPLLLCWHTHEPLVSIRVFQRSDVRQGGVRIRLFHCRSRKVLSATVG
uniref:Uncharacterized protein n=1 Tax=Anopheles darlingi TaxID=43151 RepID=A0A2M4DRT0_ANODA